MNKKMIFSIAAAAAITFTGVGAINTNAASLDQNVKVYHYNQYKKVQCLDKTSLKGLYTFANSLINIRCNQGNVVIKPCPDNNQTTPEVEKPNTDNNKPEADQPVVDNNKPEADQPVVDNNKPEADQPVVDNNKPEADQPVVDDNKPEVDQPVVDNNNSEVDQPTQDEEKPSVSGEVSAFEQKVVELTNAERAKQGLPALKLDTELSKVARIKSQDMKDRNYFDHNSPTYGSPFDMMTKFGISYKSAGENIAQGQRSPEEVVQAWMNSQGHRENIMNASYTHIGVGHVSENNYWTQMFIGK
ncbi:MULTISPECIES: CAP domain-containing protein [Bacillus]|uniref:CAP domain-containing protein n=1 Tax=Bacillus TaxID=1386 RepID=UPI0002DDCD98|nr:MULTISPECIES: CAP domain-containing protein [Bacillus]